MHIAFGVILIMNVDVFGCQLVNGKGSRGPPGIEFTLTPTGYYSLKNKKLFNLLDATQDDEVVNLKVLKNLKCLSRILQI